MNKELIKKRFGRKLKTYDENAKIQKQMAEKLLSFLPDSNYENVLEIGCGTGTLTKAASDIIKFKSYTANDIVEECETYINDINSEIRFVSGDIESFINNNETNYDLILANASFQWIENFEIFTKSLISHLNPNGILLFTTFGKENFREFNFMFGTSLNYHTKQILEEYFKDFCCTIEEEVRIMSFKTPKDVLKHIQNTGVNAVLQKSWTKKDLCEFESLYNNMCFNHPTLTYNPIYARIINSRK